MQNIEQAKSMTYARNPVCKKQLDKVMRIKRVWNVNLFGVGFVYEKEKEEK